MNEWATDDASSSLTDQQKHPQAERQWTESSEHYSTSEELVPYHHQPQPKRSSHYVSRRFSLSSDVSNFNIYFFLNGVNTSAIIHLHVYSEVDLNYDFMITVMLIVTPS